MHDDRTVRPRRIWAGLAGALLGAALVGAGITYDTIATALVGIVVLAAGSGVAVAAGIRYDTHGSRPARAELLEVREGEVHQGTAPGDMVTDPRARGHALMTSRTTEHVVAARAAAPRPGLLRAAALLLLVGGAGILGAQGLYPHTQLGQDNAVRDLGLAILICLSGLRLLVGYRPSHAPSLVAGGAGLALVLCSALTAHDAAVGSGVEAVAGAWVLGAAGLSWDRRRSRSSLSSPTR